MRARGLLFALLSLLVATSSWAQRDSRDQSGLGSAIALDYTIQHDVMRPAEDVTLELCLTNQNSESTRDVQQGDSFAWTFLGGTVGACGPISVISPGGELQAADFACALDGQSVRLTRMSGGAVPWPPFDSVCVRIPYATPAATTRATTSMSVGNVGAFRPPSPGSVLLSVGNDLGSVGPMGPVGPEGATGPAGPAGAPGVGASVMAVSTDSVTVHIFDPPTVVPGLDVLIDIADASRLEVTLDLMDFYCNLGILVGERLPVYYIEVDSVAVVERTYSGFAGPPTGSGQDIISASWLSAPLAAGSHRVRVLVGAGMGSGDHSRCVGAPYPLYEARLIVKEIRSAP